MGDPWNPKGQVQVVSDLNVWFSETDQFASVFNSGILTLRQTKGISIESREENSKRKIAGRAVTEFNDTSVLEASRESRKGYSQNQSQNQIVVTNDDITRREIE